MSELSLEEFYSYRSFNLDIHKNLIELCRNTYSNLNSRIINASGWRRVNTRTRTWISSNKNEKNNALKTDIRMCLNVINNTNFDKIYNKLKNLKIITRDHMMILIDQIFTNVIMAPTFVKIYAVLCKNLSSYYIKSGTDTIYFRKLFLKKCKISFEILIKLNGEDEIRDTIFKFKENLNNYILFLGELYMKDMLVDKIINLCFTKLIGTTSPQKSYQVKLICELMKVVGRKFYNRKYDKATAHFDKILEIEKSKKYKMKEKCLIMDLKDVKNKEQWK